MYDAGTEVFVGVQHPEVSIVGGDPVVAACSKLEGSKLLIFSLHDVSRNVESDVMMLPIEVLPRVRAQGP
jgi:hypothetical protein